MFPVDTNSSSWQGCSCGAAVSGASGFGSAHGRLAAACSGIVGQLVWMLPTSCGVQMAMGASD